MVYQKGRTRKVGMISRKSKNPKNPPVLKKEIRTEKNRSFHPYFQSKKNREELALIIRAYDQCENFGFVRITCLVQTLQKLSPYTSTKYIKNVLLQMIHTEFQDGFLIEPHIGMGRETDVVLYDPSTKYYFYYITIPPKTRKYSEYVQKELNE